MEAGALLAEAVLRVIAELVVFVVSVVSALCVLVNPKTYFFKRKKFERVFITGASSGLGAALAKKFARDGVSLVLTARRVEKLEQVAEDCRAKGAEVSVVALDVTDRDACASCIAEADEMKPIDCLIANAGVSLKMLNLKPNPNDVLKALMPLTDVNVGGVFACIAAIAPKMAARKRGQIVIMSSCAGNFPMWEEPSYSASKVAVRYYGESLRTVRIK